VRGTAAEPRSQSRRGGHLRADPHVLRGQREQARDREEVRHQRYSTHEAERVNHIDKLAKQTPIYYAARRGHMEMCQLLIEKGADITILDMSNKTVVEYAKKAKFLEVADYLAG
jgi:hypothetical protein